eukprot:3230373-Prymnesium_polylepis.1
MQEVKHTVSRQVAKVEEQVFSATAAVKNVEKTLHEVLDQMRVMNQKFDAQVEPPISATDVEIMQ